MRHPFHVFAAEAEDVRWSSLKGMSLKTLREVRNVVLTDMEKRLQRS